MEVKKTDEKFDYDFSGWATRYDVKCTDGRTIKRDTFAGDDGMIVPIFYEFNHMESTRGVLGNALLCNRPEGVYMYGKCNDTYEGQNAKAMVQSGDITSLGIYANRIKYTDGTKYVVHGSIKAVSLVNFPANPGAVIDYVVPDLNGHGCSTCKHFGNEICQCCFAGNMWTAKED